MRHSVSRLGLLALSIALSFNPVLVMAGGMTHAGEMGKANYISPKNTPPVSNRLIVKFKPSKLLTGLSDAQINAQLSQPLTPVALVQLQTAAGTPLTELHAIANGAHVLAVASQPTRPSLDKMIAGIASLPNVEYVEEDKIMTVQAVPNDTYYLTGPTGNPGLWGMWPVTAVASPAPGGTGNYGADFQTAWGAATGTGVVVAVVDTGITPHVDIVGAGGTVSPATGNLVSPGYDFTSDCRIRGTCVPTTPTAGATVAPSPNASDLGDFISIADSTTVGSFFYGYPVSNSSWHGTHVSGTIAALGNNAVGVIGGAYTAKILPVRVLGKGGGYISDIANGMMWAAGVHPTIANPNPAKVINMSLGGGGACSTTEQNAINAAVAAGTTVVVAAGNSNADVANFDPANCANVVTVASIARDGSRAAYSNFSSPSTNPNPVSVTLAAQGGDQASYPAAFDPGILSTLNAGAQAPDLTVAGTSFYQYYQGTSMATPHVAATVALMLAANPALTPAKVKTLLSATAALTPFPSFPGSVIVPPAWDCAASKNCGAGILNAKLAVAAAAALTTTTPTVTASPVTVGQATTVNLSYTNPTATALKASVLVLSQPSFMATSVDNCSNVTLATNASCTVSVILSPHVPGNYSVTASLGSVGGLTSAVATITGRANPAYRPSGGGCSVMPAGANPDSSLPLAMLVILAYWMRQRMNGARGEV